MFSYINRTCFFLTPFQIRRRSPLTPFVKYFPKCIISQFFFPELHFHNPSIFTTLFSCKLNERDNILKHLYNSRCKFFKLGRLPSVLVKRSSVQSSGRVPPLDMTMVYHFQHHHPCEITCKF